jgi:hypothetical protein
MPMSKLAKILSFPVVAILWLIGWIMFQVAERKKSKCVTDLTSSRGKEEKDVGVEFAVLSEDVIDVEE